jgi:hypothetical protein
MLRSSLVVLVIMLGPVLGHTQEQRPERKGDGAEPPAIQHGAQPNPEVRPGSPDGDSSSRTAGRLVEENEVERRILGLPVTAVLVIAAVLVALLALAWLVIPRPGRRHEARGGGTYGRR